MRIFIRLIFSFFSKSGVTHVTDTISETESEIDCHGPGDGPPPVSSTGCNSWSSNDLSSLIRGSYHIAISERCAHAILLANLRNRIAVIKKP